MLRTVLFDFDGTLVPSLDFWLDGFKYAFDQIGVGVTEEQIIEHCFYRKDVEIVKSFNLPCAETFWKYTEESLRHSYAKPTLFPGVLEVLDQCKSSGLAIGLVTSSERSFVHTAMTNMNIRHYFSAVVTANDVTHFKPHPEPVIQALQHLDSVPEETLFIGDYVVDVLAGKAAGTGTALFYTSQHQRFHQYEHVASSEPDFIFSDYSHLLDKLRAQTLAAVSPEN